MAAAAPARGWVRVSAPFPVHVYEEGQLIGVSQRARLALSVGAHQLDVVNDALGFRQTQAVDVVAHETALLSVEAATAPVSLNALPWAEVDIDGRPMGETPLASITLPLGNRTITFRHPTLGTRTTVLTVKAGDTNRLSVDLRQ